MNNNKYSNCRNIQIIVYLLKARNIRKVVASPGTQNMNLVVTMQRDPYFEMYSAADERSAAYMACGLSAESGEPVVLSCTGATASRNYIPGLTEAFYRQLPIVAITSTEPLPYIGHDIAQIIDRRSQMDDVIKISVTANDIHNEIEEWDCTLQVNKALLELNHHGQGPVHINLVKGEKSGFDCAEIPKCRIIDRIIKGDSMPPLPKGRIAIYAGSHKPMNQLEIEAIDRFCSIHNAVVFCDHTSNYDGQYKVLSALIASQDWNMPECLNTDLLIQIGSISGNYYQASGIGAHTKEVWRINEDGKIKDTFQKLRYVFEMSETAFFNGYNIGENSKSVSSYIDLCTTEYENTYAKLPKLPFSNIWVASKLAPKMPPKCVIHYGILNSLRSWNFFKIPAGIECFSNVGGFGIDGGMSSLIGSSLANPQKLHFGIFGDLAFFYDMNVLGNRHICRNVRIILINNGNGTEFKLYQHPASALGEETNEYISASRHYGNKSPLLIKHYAEDLGFEYLSASDNGDFNAVYSRFLTPEITDKPMLFEIFTDVEDENNALKSINSIIVSKENQRKLRIKELIGENTAHSIQRFINKLK